MNFSINICCCFLYIFVKLEQNKRSIGLRDISQETKLKWIKSLLLIRWNMWDFFTLWLRPPKNHQRWSYTHSHNLTPTSSLLFPQLRLHRMPSCTSSVYSKKEKMLTHAHTRIHTEPDGNLCVVTLNHTFLLDRKCLVIPLLYDNNISLLVINLKVVFCFNEAPLKIYMCHCTFLKL